MRKLLSIVIIYSCVAGQTLYAQFASFDSSQIIASSPNFDYKNPTHCTNTHENIHLYNLNKNWMAYEKYSNDSTSNIIVRQYDYDGYGIEISLTNDSNVLNINPSISGDENDYIIVWQSNLHGHWDLFFSIYSSGMWSKPNLVDSTSLDKKNPTLWTGYDLGYFLLAFEKENNINVKVYTNSWVLDTIITRKDSSLSNPRFGNFYYSSFLSFMQSTGDSSGHIHSKYVYYNKNTHALQWSEDIIVPFANTGNAYSLPAFGGEYITFDADTSGSRRAYFFSLSGANFGILADPLNGDVTKVRTNQFPIVTDGLGQIQAFASLYRTNDSSFICAKSYYYSNSNPSEYSYFYIGDTNVKSELSMSNVSYNIMSPKHYLKYRVVWEQDVNGRTALVESFMTDYSTSLNNISTNLPEHFTLHQNYPNPFNPTTKIKFDIPKQGFVSLSVYDLTGKEVGTLVSSQLNAGVYEYSFDGSGLGSGVYFYRLETGGYIETRRMVLIK